MDNSSEVTDLFFNNNKDIIIQQQYKKKKPRKPTDRSYKNNSSQISQKKSTTKKAPSYSKEMTQDYYVKSIVEKYSNRQYSNNKPSCISDYSKNNVFQPKEQENLVDNINSYKKMKSHMKKIIKRGKTETQHENVFENPLNGRKNTDIGQINYQFPSEEAVSMKEIDYVKKENTNFYWPVGNLDKKIAISKENSAFSMDVVPDLCNIQKSQDFLNKSLVDRNQQYINKYDAYPRHMGYLLDLYGNDSPAYNGS